MNILLASDDNYAPYLATVIDSILTNTPAKINFFILDLGIEIKLKSMIQSIVNSRNSQVSFIPISAEEFDSFSQPIIHISKAAYARLKMGEYLPKEINRIIYIDIDILVNSSLIPLWESDLQGKTIGAIIDDISYPDHSLHDHISKIGLPENTIYFNSGVLLIDLNKWRNINVFEESLKLMKKYKDQIYYVDQDILNIIFHQDKTLLDTRFNFMPCQRNRLKSSTMPLLSKTTMPLVIIHYCGPQKPWHSACNHSYANKFISLSQKLERKYGFDTKYEKLTLLRKFKRFYRDLRNRLIYKIL